jgi:hypothetical protein
MRVPSADTQLLAIKCFSSSALVHSEVGKRGLSASPAPGKPTGLLGEKQGRGGEGEGGGGGAGRPVANESISVFNENML